MIDTGNQGELKIAIIDNYNIYATDVFTPHLVEELKGDIICYVPRYRSDLPTGSIPKRIVKPIWGQFDFPFSLFKALRKDRRNVVFFPLEEVTMGNTGISLMLIPLMLLLFRLSSCKVILNLQGAIPIRIGFSNSIKRLIPNTRVPSSLLQIAIFSIYYYTFSLSDQIQVFSRTFAQRVLEYGRFLKKIRLVDFGVGRLAEKTAFRSSGKFQLLSKGNQCFLSFGYVVPRRGLDILLRSWAQARKNKSDGILMLAGDTKRNPKYVEELRHLTAELGIEDSVVFTGTIASDEIDELFENSDCVIFPYVYSDSLSGPLCTALQHHKPIIATNIGIFSDFKNEILLCDPEDVDSLARGIEMAYDKDILNSLLESSAKIASRLDWKKVALQYAKLLNEVACS